MGLNYDTLRAANILRLPRFKNAKGERAHTEDDGSDWSPAEWLQAVTGELGELANMLKKVKRGDYDFEDGREAIAKEFADIAIYLDLFAYQFRIDLGKAVQDKFNEVTDRVDAGVWIGNDDAIYVQDGTSIRNIAYDDQRPEVIASVREPNADKPEVEKERLTIDMLPMVEGFSLLEDMEYFTRKMMRLLSPGSLKSDK